MSLSREEQNEKWALIRQVCWALVRVHYGSDHEGANKWLRALGSVSGTIGRSKIDTLVGASLRLMPPRATHYQEDLAVYEALKDALELWFY